MSMTYPTTTNDTLRPYGDTVRPRAEARPDVTMREDEVFVPRYARSRKKTGVRTWMILAPIGALALAAGAVAVLSASPTETQPLVQPEPALAPLTPAPAAIDPATVIPPATPAIAASEPAPAPAPAIQRRQAAAPAARRAAPAPRVETARPAPAAAVAVEPTGPRPYSAAPTTASTTTATPSPAAPATTPPPVVIVEPAT